MSRKINALAAASGLMLKARCAALEVRAFGVLVGFGEVWALGFVG